MAQRKQKNWKLTRQKIFFSMLLIPGICWLSTSQAQTDNYDLVHQLSNSNINFAFKYFQILADQAGAMISPFSIGVALTMTSFGAGHNTLKQLNDALDLNGFKQHTDIGKGYSTVMKSLNFKGDITLIFSNRIFIENSYTIKQEFKDILENDFSSGAESVNLNDGQSLDNEINKMVEQTTMNKVKTLKPIGGGDKYTGAVLVSAIYFKGAWEKKFSKEKTLSEHFKLINGGTTVPMMNIQSEFNYAENEILDSRILQLDFSGSRMVMYVILPNMLERIKMLKQNLNPQLFETIRKSMTLALVKLKLPKFNSTCTKDLKSDLPNLHITDLLSEANVDLNGMANPSVTGSYLFVQKVLYTAYVEVNDDGAEAFAVPEAEGYGRGEGVGYAGGEGSPKLIEFYANHPFVFIIYDTFTNFILFIGSVDDPSKQ